MGIQIKQSYTLCNTPEPSPDPASRANADPVINYHVLSPARYFDFLGYGVHTALQPQTEMTKNQIPPIIH